MFLNVKSYVTKNYGVYLNRKHEMFLNFLFTPFYFFLILLNRKHEMFLNKKMFEIAEAKHLLNRKHEMFLNHVHSNM